MEDDARPTLTVWKGERLDAGLRRARPATRTAATARRSSSARSSRRSTTTRKGVPIDAILFGGRRKTTIPLVTEARDWTHGTFMGATLSSARPPPQRPARSASYAATRWRCCRSSATTPATTSTTGSRRQGATTPPSCRRSSTSTGSAATRTVASSGPGFGENSRVLKWVVERIDGQAEAVETPIGHVPTAERLDTDGLDMTRRAARAGARGRRRGVEGRDPADHRVVREVRRQPAGRALDRARRPQGAPRRLTADPTPHGARQARPHGAGPSLGTPVRHGDHWDAGCRAGRHHEGMAAGGRQPPRRRTRTASPWLETDLVAVRSTARRSTRRRSSRLDRRGDPATPRAPSCRAAVDLLDRHRPAAVRRAGQAALPVDPSGGPATSSSYPSPSRAPSCSRSRRGWTEAFSQLGQVFRARRRPARARSPRSTGSTRSTASSTPSSTTAARSCSPPSPTAGARPATLAGPRPATCRRCERGVSHAHALPALGAAQPGHPRVRRRDRRAGRRGPHPRRVLQPADRLRPAHRLIPATEDHAVAVAIHDKSIVAFLRRHLRAGLGARACRSPSRATRVERNDRRRGPRDDAADARRGPQRRRQRQAARRQRPHLRRLHRRAQGGVRRARPASSSAGRWARPRTAASRPPPASPEPTRTERRPGVDDADTAWTRPTDVERGPA